MAEVYPSTPPLLCGHCQAPLRTGAEFCTKCGTRVLTRPGTPPAKKKRNWKLIGGVIAGTLVLMCVCLSGLTVYGMRINAAATATAEALVVANAPTVQPTSEPTQMMAPTATVAPSPTVEPTPAPEPTDVPTAEPTVAPTAEPTVAPTNTSIAPTATVLVPTVEIPTIVVPTVAPEAGLSSEARAYFGEAGPILSDYGDAIGTLGQLSTNAGQDSQLMLSGEWKLDVAVVLAELSIAGDRLGDLDAGGSEAQPIDDLLQQIADETGPLVTDYAEGVDEFDAEKFGSAATRMRTVAGLIGEVQGEMVKFEP